MNELQPVNLLLLEATDGAYAKTVSIFKHLAFCRFSTVYPEEANSTNIDPATFKPERLTGLRRYCLKYTIGQVDSRKPKRNPSVQKSALPLLSIPNLHDGGEDAFRGNIRFVKGPLMSNPKILDAGYWRRLFNSDSLHGICLVISDETSESGTAIDRWNEWYSSVYREIAGKQPNAKVDLYVIFITQPLRAQFDAAVPDEATQRIRRFCLQGDAVASHPEERSSDEADAHDGALTRFLESVLVDVPVKASGSKGFIRPRISSISDSDGKGKAREGEYPPKDGADALESKTNDDGKRTKLAELHFQLTSASHILHYRLTAYQEDIDQEIRELQASLKEVKQELETLEMDRQDFQFWTQPDIPEILTEVQRTHTFKNVFKPTPDFKGTVNTKFPIRLIRYGKDAGQTTGTYVVKRIVNPTTFEYHIKNDRFKDARCHIQICGYRHEINIADITDLQSKIAATEPSYQENLRKRKKMEADLYEASQAQQLLEVLLARCKSDLERLRKPHLLDWDFVQTRRNVLAGSVVGLAEQFKLAAVMPWDEFLLCLNWSQVLRQYNIGDTSCLLDRPAFEALQPICEAISKDMSRRLEILHDSQTYRGHNFAMAVHKYYNPAVAYANLFSDSCSADSTEIEELYKLGMQENCLSPNHTEEFERLAMEAAADVNQAISEYEELRETSFRCLRDGFAAQALKSGRNRLAPSAAMRLQEAERDARAGFEACNQLLLISDKNYVPIGIYAALRWYQNSSTTGTTASVYGRFCHINET